MLWNPLLTILQSFLNTTYACSQRRHGHFLIVFVLLNLKKKNVQFCMFVTPHLEYSMDFHSTNRCPDFRTILLTIFNGESEGNAHWVLLMHSLDMFSWITNSLKMAVFIKELYSNTTKSLPDKCQISWYRKCSHCI